MTNLSATPKKPVNHPPGGFVGGVSDGMAPADTTDGGGAVGDEQDRSAAVGVEHSLRHGCGLDPGVGRE